MMGKYNLDSEIVREQGDVNTTSKKKSFVDSTLNASTKDWFEKDKQFFLHQNLSTPVLNVLKEVDGAVIEDLAGRKYIDMHGNGVHNVGFHNPQVIAAVKKKLDSKLAFCPRRYTNLPIIELAQKLTTLTPKHLNKVLFCPGGSEAIEMALMLAKQVTKRFKTISFRGSYHGTTMGAASVSGEELFSGGLGPMVPGAFHVDYPNYYRNPWGFETPEAVDRECLRQMEDLFKHHKDIACVIGEPISATPVVPSKSYWQSVKALCEQYGALLIFDEVITGLGRSGKMFAAEHFVDPDIMVLGKSLGGGVVPFAGIAAHERFDILQHRSIGHYTHEKNPLCAAAANAVLDYLVEHNICRRVQELGAYFFENLHALKKRYALIGHVSHCGLHLGLDLVLDQDKKTKAIEQAEEVMLFCYEKGLAFKVIEGSVLTFRPALTITKEQIDHSLSILEDSLQSL